MAKRINDNVRNKILINTQKIIEDIDIHNISLSEIAQATGVSKGTLYYYYNTKDQLLLDVTEMMLDEQMHALFSWINDPTKDTSFHRLVMYIMKYDTMNFCQRSYLIYSAINGNETVRNLFIEKYREFTHIISNLIAERISGVDPNFVTWLLLLLSDGIILQKSLNNNYFNSEEFIEKCTFYAKFLEDKKNKPTNTD